MNKRTVVENDQSKTAGSINSVRRAVYVKEAIMQTGEHSIVYKGDLLAS